MNAGTHRAGGLLVSVIGFAWLRYNNLLLQDVHPVAQWAVIYPFTLWGSVASDLDHHLASCPVKDYPSRAVNTVLHITKPLQKFLDNRLKPKDRERSLVYKLSELFYAKHRSWQTHSELTVILLLYLLRVLRTGNLPQFGAVDLAILTLVFTGITMGVLAHLLLDMLTNDGIWCICLVILNKLINLAFPRFKLRHKIALVPDKPYFAGGGVWENKVRKLLGRLTTLALFWFLGVLILPVAKELIPFEIYFGG